MKQRLDLIVSEKENISREKAQKLIMAGHVLVDKIVVDKVGIQIDDKSEIYVKESFPYVSRGALKLEKAYQEFNLNFTDKVICDVGASTGGFTDFALQHGAAKVFAIDTGYGQIAQKLRDDERVILLEKTNIKNVASLPEKIDFFVIDVSFISLKQVLPAVQKIDKNAQVVALIKPQFEVGKQIADKTKGVIKDDAIRLAVVEEIGAFAESIGYQVLGLTDSPIEGAKGNKEYLLWLN